jgi:Protein of unknown function (DUF1592)/Protein of unknown function (DUF1588)/Protein of unknown function (DUF1595)/Protein of unknown function (DUF1587)/Protein of unknown function (DUF1585)
VRRSSSVPVSRLSFGFLSCALALSAACTGSIMNGGHGTPTGGPATGGPATGGPATGGPATGSGGSSATGAGGSPATGASGSGGPIGTGGAAVPGDPNAAGVMPLRRLTNREYNNTVHDLLGDTTLPANQFPSDRDKTFAFRRAGDLAVQDATLLRTAAEVLATAAVPKAVSGMLLPCDPATGEDACARLFIAKFGLRAFRRPVTAAETTRLMTLYTSGRTTQKLAFADTIGLLIEGILQSPQFLYHWEAAPTETTIKEGAVLRLSGYQVASRLSYFVWGSMPDDMLLTAAGAGQLDTLAGVQTAARRLLMDPKAKETVSTFFADWMELDGLKDRVKDTKAYPEYNATLQAAMLDETSNFVENVAFGGDGRLATLLGAPYSYVNQALGGVYGATVAGTAMQRTDLNPAQRAGFLTQASFLALTGAADGSNPVRRGKAVYTKLLCRSLPPPPAVVPAPKPASAGGTTRQRFVEHDQQACAKGCHTAMDPIGFAFENYDGIGKYRTMDNGMPVDATGSLTLDGMNQTFNDAVGLVGLLAKSAEVRACFADEWGRFALVRDDTPADLASFQSIAGAFGTDTATVQDLMVAVATMRSFRYRSLSPGETP